MFGEHHDLHHEFPEHVDRINLLIKENTNFARLSEQYDAVDKQVYRIEQGLETPSDDYTEELKKKRLSLKDQLYEMLVSHL